MVTRISQFFLKEAQRKSRKIEFLENNVSVSTMPVTQTNSFDSISSVCNLDRGLILRWFNLLRENQKYCRALKVFTFYVASCKNF